MKRIMIAAAALLLVLACRSGEVKTTPVPPIVQKSNADTAYFFWQELPASYYSDGRMMATIGYTVRCQRSAGSDIETVTLDVIGATNCLIKDIIKQSGAWYCGVSAFDEIGRTPYTEPLKIEWDGVNFS